MLDPRLHAIAQLVRPGHVVCDVGTDHGYLPVWLAEQGIVPHAWACDINEKPLAAARRTVESAGVGDRVTVCRSDGLSQIPPGAVQDIVMAGMGGELIARLLLECGWAADLSYRFLLQPMTRASFLRRELCRHGFALEREIPVLDGPHRYTVMQAAYTGQANEPEELFCRVGRIPEERSPAAAAWLRGEAARERKIAAGLLRSPAREQEAPAHTELARRIEELAAVLEQELGKERNDI